MKLKDIALLLGGELKGNPEMEISGASGLEDAREGDISFVAEDRGIPRAMESRASCVLVKGFATELDKAQLKVENPHYAFAILLEHFYKSPRPKPGVHKLAFVSKKASVSPEASVGAFAYVSDGASVGARTVLCPGAFVGEGSVIGEGCLVYPNVVIREGVKLGDRVIVHSGAVIGSDGFGYVMHKGKRHKMPQVGGVEIGDDVEIGACTTIDRATTGNTVIGRGTKIDNLVQVAHNVKIGEGSILVAQVGIAGSSTIGSGVVLGGQAGVADHVSIADGTVLAARSGVMSDLKKGIYAGAPVAPRREFMRSVSFLYRLPELHERIKAIEEKLGISERRDDDD